MIDQTTDPDAEQSGADTVVVLPDPDDDAPAGGRPSRRRLDPAALLDVGRWGVFLGLSALVLRPALTTAVVADDFLIPFHQYATGGASFRESLHIGWTGASAGHFNYIGQIIGAIVGWIWVQLTLHFGINFSAVFATTKFVVFMLTALAAARFLRSAAAAIGTPVSPWRSRVYVAVALFGTLQIHVAWSNDPTANYPMSGFASAAIGLWILATAIDTFLDPTPRRVVTLAALGFAGILYYEVNAAVIVAFLPLALTLAARRVNGRFALRNVVLAGIPLALPAVATVVVRLLTSPTRPEDAYSGTSISTGGTLLSTFRNAVVSGFPISAWKLTRDWLGAPFVLRVVPVAITVLVAAVLVGLARTRPAPRPGPVRSWWLTAAVVAAPVGYWLGATAIQAATPKVQAESSGIGYVYNYYAVAASCIAVLLALVALVVVPRLPELARTALVVGAASFLVLQFFISWNLTRRFNEVTLPGQQVLSTYADDRPESERCAALDAWLGGSWPEYYRQDLVNGIQWAHEEYRGDPYCKRLMGETTERPAIMRG